MSPRAAALLRLAAAHRAFADAAEAEARALEVATVPEPKPIEVSGLVDRGTAARSISVSLATLDRLVREGAPVETVGDRRRFDLPALRTWLASRGRKPTKATRREGSDDGIDVSGLALRAGLAGR